MPPVGIAVTPQSSSTSATVACFTRFRSITLRQAVIERLGFEETGRRKLYYADPPEDAVGYRRTLR